MSSWWPFSSEQVDKPASQFLDEEEPVIVSKPTKIESNILVQEGDKQGDQQEGW